MNDEQEYGREIKILRIMVFPAYAKSSPNKSLLYACLSTAVPVTTICSITWNCFESLELRMRSGKRENFGVAPISENFSTARKSGNILLTH